MNKLIVTRLKDSARLVESHDIVNEVTACGWASRLDLSRVMDNVVTAWEESHVFGQAVMGSGRRWEWHGLSYGFC